MLSWEMKHGLDAPYGDMELQCNFKPSEGKRLVKAKAKQERSVAAQEKREGVQAKRKKGKKAKGRGVITRKGQKIKTRQAYITGEEAKNKERLATSQKSYSAIMSKKPAKRSAREKTRATKLKATITRLKGQVG